MLLGAAGPATAQDQGTYDTQTTEFIIVEPMNPEPAAPEASAIIPANVEIQEPFTRETDYMSLAGYYRYAVYANTGVWMDRDEAVAALEN